MPTCLPDTRPGGTVPPKSSTRGRAPRSVPASATLAGHPWQVKGIAFRFDGQNYPTPAEGESVSVVADMPWTDADGTNHGGTRPDCLADGKYGRQVELGVLDVRGEGPWASQLVVRVHCLS